MPDILAAHDRRARPNKRRSTRRARTARQQVELRQLADRSAVPDDPEQPRPGSRRASRQARRLRRHRQGRAQLGSLRHDSLGAEAPQGRRVAARAVRKARRRFPHARGCAARPDRELESRAALGDLGAFPRARPQGIDDVRPDDGGLLDLHRLAGHRAGHVRNLRRLRAHAFRRRCARTLDPDRGARRHGRRAAARGDDGGLLDARGRLRRVAHRLSPAHRLPGSQGDLARRGARDHRRGEPSEASRSRSACSAMPRTSSPSSSNASACRTW